MKNKLMILTLALVALSNVMHARVPFNVVTTPNDDKPVRLKVVTTPNDNKPVRLNLVTTPCSVHSAKNLVWYPHLQEFRLAGKGVSEKFLSNIPTDVLTKIQGRDGFTLVSTDNASKLTKQELTFKGPGPLKYFDIRKMAKSYKDTFWSMYPFYNKADKAAQGLGCNSDVVCASTKGKVVDINMINNNIVQYQARKLAHNLAISSFENEGGATFGKVSKLPETSPSMLTNAQNVRIVIPEKPRPVSKLTETVRIEIPNTNSVNKWPASKFAINPRMVVAGLVGSGVVAGSAYAYNRYNQSTPEVQPSIDTIIKNTVLEQAVVQDTTSPVIPSRFDNVKQAFNKAGVFVQDHKVAIGAGIVAVAGFGYLAYKKFGKAKPVQAVKIAVPVKSGKTPTTAAERRAGRNK